MFSHLLYQNSSFFVLFISLVCLFSYICDKREYIDRWNWRKFVISPRKVYRYSFLWPSFIYLKHWQIHQFHLSDHVVDVFVRYFERENYVLLDDLLMMEQPFRVSTNDKMKITFTINSNGFIFFVTPPLFLFLFIIIIFLLFIFKGVQNICFHWSPSILILSFINRNL